MYNKYYIINFERKNAGYRGSFEGRDGRQGKEGGIWYGRF